PRRSLCRRPASAHRESPVTSIGRILTAALPSGVRTRPSFFPLLSRRVEFLRGAGTAVGTQEMPTAKIEIPRFSVTRVVAGVGLESEFVCAQVPNIGDEPDEDAIVLFSGRGEAQRFIAAHRLTDWVPAFIGYRELREWLAVIQNDSRWAIIDP